MRRVLSLTMAIIVVAAGTSASRAAVILPNGMPNPNDADFRVWLKADADAYADTGGTVLATDGQAVLRWDDQTANGHNAVRYGSGGDLKFATGAIGSQPALSFLGGTSGDFLQIPTYSPADDDDLTIFLVAKADAQTSGGSLMRPLLASGTLANGVGAFAISTMRGNAGGPGNLGYLGRNYNPSPYDEFTKTANPSNFSDGAGHVVNLELSGASGGGNGVFSSFYDSLVTETHNGTTNNPINGLVQIGGDATDSARRFAGDIAELLIYDRALTPGERFQVKTYLEAKYGMATLPSALSSSGLMLHATLDNADVDATTVFDTSGYNRHGTLQNGLSKSGAAGQIMQALDFAGGVGNSNSEYIDLSAHVADFASLTQGSLSAWIRTDGTGVGVILAASDSLVASSEVRLFLNGDLLQFDGRNNGLSIGTLQGTTDLADGMFHHVAVTVDASGNGLLYVDGYVQDAETGIGFFNDVAGLDTMGIGRNKDSTPGGGQWFFDGLIDDVSIWDRPLSTQEVQLIYAQGLEGLSAVVVPEPTSCVLFCVGLGSIAVYGTGRRRRRLIG